MEKPVLDSFSLEGLKQLGARLQSGRRVGSSPQQYLESITACGPATKHVLYVEVVPARYLKLEHVSDSDDDLGECTQDPLMERPPSSQHNPIKKKKSKDKDRDRVRDRDKHRQRKLRKERERELKKELEIKKEIEKLEREQERSPSPSSTLPSLPSPPRSRSASPIIWSPKKKRVKKKRSKNPVINFLCNRSNCDYEANDINTLNSHKKSEHRGKDFQCDQCIYRGSTASDLRKHYRQHSGEIPYTCKMIGCDFRAKHNNSLVYHTKKYHPTGEPMKCDASDECIFTTYLKAALKHHKMMAHGGGKTLACETCPYKCYLMADLRKHHRVHTGENPYSCDFEGCRYACKISSNLKKHKRIHTEEKPYACDVCEFRTNFINSLKVHKRTHTNERPYCCDQCGYRCNHTSNLKKHVSRLHPGAIYNIVKRPNVDTTSMGIQTDGNVP